MAQLPLFSKRMTIGIDSSVLGMASDYDLSVEKDMIEISYIGNSAGWKTSTPDMKGWRVSFSGFVTNSSTAGSQLDYYFLMNKLMNTDTSVFVKLIPDVCVNIYYGGGGYIKSLSQKGAAGQPVTYSGEIQGIDDLFTYRTNIAGTYTY